MCGIGGILRVHPAGAEVPPPRVAIPDAWLDTLDEAIKHRGPDGCGRFRDRAVRADGSTVDVALVHRRLSIIDHAGGHQPMVSESGREVRGEGLVAVVFNGCIYNHRELRRELQGAGHRFVTDHSDTEVLVHGWREWGRKLPGQLDGMYACAMWARQSAQVTIMRDLVGEKPLYYADLRYPGKLTEPFRPAAVPKDYLDPSSPVWIDPHPHLFVFASSYAGLLRLFVQLGGSVQCGGFLGSLMEESSLSNWLEKGYDDRPPLAFVGQECRGLVTFPGRRGECDRTELIPPWATDDAGARREKGAPMTPERAEALLEASVRSRLEADVPLGCFLSGGVDSSLIAMLAMRAGRPLTTLTVRMPDLRYDESAWAERVAAHLGTDHRTLDVSPDPASDLVALIEQLGLPFGDSSLLPTYWVSQAARREVAVAMGGDGGDELFAGYERYVAAEMLRRGASRSVLRLVPAGLFRRAHPKSRLAKLARLRDAMSQDHSDIGKVFSYSQLRKLLRTRSGPDTLDGPGAFASGAARAIEEDFYGYLPGDILRKTDTASMAVALEMRSPFLDIELINAALSTPIGSLMPGGQRKGLLRQVARKYLPAEIVDRPKMGFAVPVSEWFRSDYGGMKTLLMDRLRSVEPFGPPSVGIELDMRFVERMIDEHMSGRRDHGQRLYMLLVLSIWGDWLGRVGRG